MYAYEASLNGRVKCDDSLRLIFEHINKLSRVNYKVLYYCTCRTLSIEIKYELIKLGYEVEILNSKPKAFIGGLLNAVVIGSGDYCLKISWP